MQFANIALLTLVLLPLHQEQDTAWLDPIEEISLEAMDAVFQASSESKPLVLHSEEQAGEYFSDDELSKLAKAVDFSQQFVLVFAWRGSGQDKLNYAVMESFPEQISFSYQPGRTRDLRLHVSVYAVRANVKWSIKGGAELDDEVHLAHFLSDEGELRFPLTLRDSQSGFAGVTGLLWKIQCDGSWTRQSFVNEDLRMTEQKGQLSKEQIRELAQALVKADMVGLTPSTGQTDVNPHVVSVTYGKKKASVILDAGSLLPQSDENELVDPVHRISYLASLMKKMMQPKDE